MSANKPLMRRRRLLCAGALAALSASSPFAPLGAIASARAALPRESYAERAPRAQEEELWDVLVVGSGLAGSAAALAALEAGAERVLLIEKGPIIGGHSFHSTGTLAVVNSPNQHAQGLVDSTDRMWEEARSVGGQGAAEGLIRKIGRESESALEWLKAAGVEFAPQVFQSLGGLTPRSLMAKSAQPGLAYTRALFEAAVRRGLVVRLNTRMTGLHSQASAVGRLWELEAASDNISATFRARSVIIATGGFTANSEMVRRYAPTLPAGMHTTANPKGYFFDGATGDGILIAESVGALLKDMNNIQLMPITGGRLLDYVGGDIFVDGEGRRFVNEGGTWKDLERALLKLPNQRMWVITDSQSKKGISLGMKLADGTVRKSDTVAEMAIAMGVDSAVLQKTLDEYNRGARDGRDPLFGKKIFTQEINRPPYYWGEERLFIHTTLGGIAIDEAAEVLSREGGIIEGLYAAGETVGGLFGQSRLGGLAMTACVVMGREAGRQAAKRAVAQVQAQTKGR